MNQKLDDWKNLWISTAIKKSATQFRCEGAVTRRAKIHLKFTLTSRCVGSCLQNFKSTNQCPLWNTTIIFRAQQSFAGHNNHFRNTTQYCDSENKQNEVSRNTKTTTNKQSNEFASLNSSYFQMEENGLFGRYYVQQLTQQKQQVQDSKHCLSNHLCDFVGCGPIRGVEVVNTIRLAIDQG